MKKARTCQKPSLILIFTRIAGHVHNSSMFSQKGKQSFAHIQCTREVDTDGDFCLIREGFRCRILQDFFCGKKNPGKLHMNII